MILHKRSCCSTWAPRKIDIEFAKDSRKKNIREEWPFPDRGILINHHLHLFHLFVSAGTSSIYHCGFCFQVNVDELDMCQYIDANTDRRTHTCSELSLRILLWIASDVQK